MEQSLELVLSPILMGRSMKEKYTKERDMAKAFKQHQMVKVTQYNTSKTENLMSDNKPILI